MRIAIVHYHLRPGGVTRVIEHAVSALARQNVQAVVLTGEAPVHETGKAPRNVRVVGGLGYERSGVTTEPEDFAGALEAAAESALGAPPDIWHVHNHSLGKNRFLPEAVFRLARSGRRMLLQIHDFAEDGRPKNFLRLLKSVGQGDIGRLGARLYPQAPHVHYAALNPRDRAFLAAAGAPEAQLHLLPNAVRIKVPEKPAALSCVSGDGEYFIYPTRAIRRKNLGEFLLWSAVAVRGTFATTLAPKNPAARPIYDRWVNFAASLGLPVEFGIAEKTTAPFPAIMQSADALVTTSVAEGFGLSFLEPWLVGRPLLGRNLPEITTQFDAAGVDLSDLYERLEVPVNWIGAAALRERIRTALEKYMQAYGRSCNTPDDVDRAFCAFVSDDRVDFGRLDEPFQERIIEQLSKSASDRKQLRPRSLGPLDGPRSKIEPNRQAVLKRFSLQDYGERLAEIYERILSSEVKPPGELSAKKLLDAFLDPARFCLLRTN